MVKKWNFFVVQYFLALIHFVGLFISLICVWSRIYKITHRKRYILLHYMMPAKNNTNLGLAACFQTNTLFRNRHIRVYYAVCAPRLSLKTRRNTCKQPKRRYFR